MSKKKIIFTGGGSGGHAVPAMVLIEHLLKDNQCDIFYIGSKHGIESKLAQENGIQYYSILTGKLRRYFSLQNIVDIFKVEIAILQSIFILLLLGRTGAIVFSTGGFVSVPVVVAAWILRIPIFIHEQTSRLGLANRICSRFAKKIFISFEGTRKFLPSEKTVFSGCPLRNDCYNEAISIIELAGIKINDIKRPIVFITGGGNGSLPLNQLVKKHLNELSEKYFVIHQVGKNFIDEYAGYKIKNYLPIDFVKSIIDVYKLSEVIISRAGAGTVCELIALGKKSILVPLKIAQKNEQFHNATEAKKMLDSIIIEDDNLKNVNLMKVLQELSSKTKINKLNSTEKKPTEIIIAEIKKELE